VRISFIGTVVLVDSRRALELSACMIRVKALNVPNQFGP